MNNYSVTAFGTGKCPEYLVTDEVFGGSAEQIENAIGEVPPGTIIYTVGYASIKQFGLDGSWVEVQ